MENIVNALNSIYGSVIKDINVNMFDKEISFDLTLVDSGIKTNHKLKFINCASFLWMEKPVINTDSYDFRNWDYYELSSIDLCTINTTSKNKWLKQYPMSYNVAIEIWETALLIQAEAIIIDEKQYLIS